MNSLVFGYEAASDIFKIATQCLESYVLGMKSIFELHLFVVLFEH